MKILILGDVGASKKNLQAFCNADNDLFSPEIQEKCAEADIVLLNLEKPLTNIISPLGKCPPDYIAPAETINGIKLLHPTAVTLANNHIMDQQNQGLQSTMNVLKQNGIQYVGVGNSLQEARRPIIFFEHEETRVGVYACCEKEFSFATDTTPGANAFDPLVTFDDIVELKKECDYLIVLFHGGMQDYPYPTPYQQRVCRKMCNKGADLIVCQHSHIIGCEEHYSGSTIVYGQGNLLLDDVDTESWHNGIILSIDIDKNIPNMDILPTEVNNHKVIIHHNADKIKKLYYDRSQEILDQQFVDQSFRNYCNNKLSDYLMKLSGIGSISRKIIKKLNAQELILLKYNKCELYYILDYLYCDTHREAIEKSIEDRIECKKRH